MDYEQTLEEAQKKLNDLITSRDAIDHEIEALVHIIEGAKIAVQDPSYWDPDNPKTLAEREPTGFTDSVRTILRRSRVPLLPTEIRDALEAYGIEGSSPKNLLIHVHKVLGRLVDGYEIEQIPRDGKMTYRWLSELMRGFRAAVDVATLRGFGPDDKAKPIKRRPAPPDDKRK
jgi:hypothetical protein